RGVEGGGDDMVMFRGMGGWCHGDDDDGVVGASVVVMILLVDYRWVDGGDDVGGYWWVV
ncbi:hypothetical protein Tco_0625371, partial [Tanacetum coccineum]